MSKRKASRLAKRIFRPLLTATEPVKLDLRGVDPMDAYDAIREVGDMVRCTDAPNPLEARYIFTAGSAGAFRPWTEKFVAWVVRNWR